MWLFCPINRYLFELHQRPGDQNNFTHLTLGLLDEATFYKTKVFRLLPETMQERLFNENVAIFASEFY